MNKKVYEAMKRGQDSHWWALGRKRIIEKVLKKHINSSRKIQIADIGCGFGMHVPLLKEYGNVLGTEIHQGAINHTKTRYKIPVIKWKFPEKLDKKFDLIVLTDVLEHVPNDKKAISWMCDHLNNNGHILLTVPAHKFLWSEMDDIAHHHRRYNRESLLNLFNDKFITKKLSYYNLFLFPFKVLFVIFSRTIHNLFPKKEKQIYYDIPPKIVNEILKFIFRVEAALIDKAKLPYGVSIIALFQKKSNL